MVLNLIFFHIHFIKERYFTAILNEVNVVNIQPPKSIDAISTEAPCTELSISESSKERSVINKVHH